jgi:hypothetical protein
MSWNPNQALGVTIYRGAVDSSPGVQTLIAAVSGKKIRVLQFCIFRVSGTGTLLLESSGGANRTAEIDAVNTAPAIASFNPFGWIETVAGEGLRSVVTSDPTVFTVLLAYTLVE